MAFYKIKSRKNSQSKNCSRQSQKYALNIASAAGTLIYGPEINDSIRVKKKIYRGFILIENFKRVYLEKSFLKSVDILYQKLMY